jgi:hypothetical protein
MYSLALTPMLLFLVLYAIEWRHMKHTAESYQLVLFIGALALLTVNSILFNFFHIELEIIRIFSRVLQITIGLTLWYFAYALLRYQVIPRRKRAKLVKQVRKLAEEERRLSGQG